MLSNEEYQRITIRMWDSLRSIHKGEQNCEGVVCETCPFKKLRLELNGCCGAYMNAVKAIEIVEQWGKEHWAFLHQLPDYHFDRDDFINAFKEIFTDEQITDLEVRCQGSTNAYDFLLYYQDDTFYIMHLVSGTIISWYKHLGRANTCNREDFDLSDLKIFLTLLKEDIDLLPGRGGSTNE